MTSRRLQIVLSVVVIFVCTGYLVQESLLAPKPLAGRSELSECHFLLSHSYVDGADGLQLIKSAARALEPHLPADSLQPWEGVEEEEALQRLEQMVQLAENSGLDRQKAVYLGMDAMVGSLNDPFTRAMDPDQYAEFQKTLSSQPFGGVGVQLGLGEGGTIIVFKVLEGSPASKAGVLVGDLVLSVSGQAVEGFQPRRVEEMIHGEVGTAVNLTMSRDGVRYELNLERVVLKTRSVRSRLMSTPSGRVVGWITVEGMKEETGQELKEELESLRESGSPAGLILDLRDNMGGYVNAALAVSSQFLESGLPVVEIASRDGSEVKATLEKEYDDSPLLVFVNGHTASSAEIVAACLADYDRAVLVGERTFGKGSVQSIHEFDSGGALKFTVARYKSPEGRAIDGTGLEPHVQLDEREILSHCEELWKQTVR